MVKVQLPLVGAEIGTKELLILIGGIGVLFYLVKRGVTKQVEEVVEKVKPVFTEPGYAIHDFFNPKEYNPVTDNWSFAWQQNLNEQIKTAQSGGYTHRADSEH